MKKVRTLLVGAGNFGESWARSVIPGCAEAAEFVGIVDRRPERLQQFRGIAPLYTDLRDALQAAKPELVVNVTPPDMHTPLNRLLLKSGVAVLCEKPLADSDENADGILAIAEKTGGFLMIGDNYRYLPVLRRLRGMIGEYGAVRRVSCSFRRRHPDMSMLYHGRLAHPLLEDVTIHHLDVARYLTGEEPVNVWCREYAAPHSWYGQRPASAVIVSDMTGGVCFTYEGTLAAPATVTDWNGVWEIECGPAVLQLRGSEIRVVTQEGVQVVGGFDPKEDSRIQELLEACEALRAGRRGETDIADNIRSFRWMTGAIRSAEEGRTIRLGKE